jgi:pimeloyl-ACP methyl ester carboxylesterase
MAYTRRIFATRFGQLHVRSNEGKGVPLVLLHPSPRSGGMWERLQERLERPTHAPDRLGYGFSDAPPWALTLEQYAQCTIDALKAAGLQAPFDLLGAGAGAVEAIEISHQLPLQVRRLVAFGMPLFTPEEAQRQMEKYSEQPLKPAAEGGHVLGAWRGCFAYRQPPYDLADVHRRFVEHVLAANPGATLRALSAYPIERRLKGLKMRVTVLAPHDDLIEQTARVKSLLRSDDAYVDLPDWGMDAALAADRLAELINRLIPA